MASSFSALVTIADGRLKFVDGSSFKALAALFGAGEELELFIEAASQKGTERQRRFFHGPVIKAFMNLGWAKQEAKDMLCLMFIPKEVRQVDGTIVLVPGHTSDLSVEDYDALIESCIQLAAENDQIVESADEWRARQQPRKGAA